MDGMADEHGYGDRENGNRDGDADQHRSADPESFLITTAAPDRDAVFRARKRRYFIMMSIRIPALIIASIVYGVTQNGWIALAIIVASIPIPWIAVLKANDAEPRKHGEVRTYHYGDARNVQPELSNDQGALHPPHYDDDAAHPVIDSEVEPGPDEAPRDEPHHDSHRDPHEHPGDAAAS